MKLEQIRRLYTEFGADIALSSACASSTKMAAPWKHRCILRYLKEEYSGLISRYKLEKAETKPAASATPGTIWTMWWQGTDDLPEVVSMCYGSVNRHRGNHPFTVLTRDNYQEYVSLPDYVLDKVQSGAITITHLSDIIRFALLTQYGGLWLDSTIFVSDRIPEDIFTAEYFTVRRPVAPKSSNVALDRWTAFLHAAKKGNLLCRFVYDFFMEYWRTQNSLINYFLIDYTIGLACEELPECRKLLDAVPVVNADIYRLEDMMNRKWDPAVFEEIKANALFSKLSWRKGGRKRTSSGEETIYGHLASLT